jgi:hypothetical protein
MAQGGVNGLKVMSLPGPKPVVVTLPGGRIGKIGVVVTTLQAPRGG